MPGSIHNTVILAKVETTAGTDAAPTAGADAVLIRVSNLSAKVEQLFAERDIVRGTFGAPDKLPYTRRGAINFSVELQGSGTAGTAPEWGDLLIGCGLAETITAGSRVEYTPASTNLKTLTIWAYINGKLEKFAFAVGNFKLNMQVGQVGTLDFSFQALVTSVAAGAAPTPTLAAWVKPLPVGPINTGQLVLGGAYATGAITGGTGYNFQTLGLDAGSDVQTLELAATERIDLFNRVPKLNVVADIGGAAIAGLYAAMQSATPTSVGVVHGSTAGRKVIVYAPAATLAGIDDQVNGNVILNALDLVPQPTAAANDDFRIVAA